MYRFDPVRLGLESHYNTKQQQIIRRLILEDWKNTDVKLPTYMKLMARYLIPLGVPDDWLKKLSHQTMAKMLHQTATPRQTFWACLHLYLTRKYGDIGLTAQGSNDLAILGQALKRFAAKENLSRKTGLFSLDEQTALAVLALEERDGYQTLYLIHRTQSHEPFAEAVYRFSEGAAVAQESGLIGLLRHVSDRQIQAFEADPESWSLLTDLNLQARLIRFSPCLAEVLA